MPPLLLLLLLIAVTAAAFLISALLRKASSARLSALASTWQMRFTPEDRFQLTPRIAAHFPTPGAADVVLRNLIYGQEAAGSYRYFFTIEYTLGVVRTKRRRVAVGMLLETARGPNASPFSGVTLAPPELPLAQQYEWLRQQHGASLPTQ
jgi:hypothetical protein